MLPTPRHVSACSHWRGAILADVPESHSGWIIAAGRNVRLFVKELERKACNSVDKCKSERGRLQIVHSPRGKRNDY
ncbi:hypothetical protein MPTK1_1g01740 [Marchantia polymorpha subsp. ruderalis]|uniref:Uncharacterized protein n=2 Tax=Marchantia polymorpha TaxID=3197 RepID=A0AAF6AKH0_MARPO|nr:hypothetical protein MARPO_0029s0071 [Marchantia polymorpha]BBM96940.1 hypothetical protein Mp_1g01740 [Marchantia polymorpha subsp. ruderalis]|eukprot:PTQ42541.1 hypothetical protein MARPO_0029s0071 [Marchantia polymorpha]